mmetsp:Transcript_93720/g.292043  ORF Transcript_93720/g.292043 Transcript_93720/m.292043 type:complete len:510 (-) Transcript_93720:173-1702(-)
MREVDLLPGAFKSRGPSTQACRAVSAKVKSDFLSMRSLRTPLTTADLSLACPSRFSRRGWSCRASSASRRAPSSARVCCRSTPKRVSNTPNRASKAAIRTATSPMNSPRISADRERTCAASAPCRSESPPERWARKPSEETVETASSEWLPRPSREARSLRPTAEGLSERLPAWRPSADALSMVATAAFATSSVRRPTSARARQRSLRSSARSLARRSSRPRAASCASCSSETLRRRAAAASPADAASSRVVPPPRHRDSTVSRRATSAAPPLAASRAVLTEGSRSSNCSTRTARSAARASVGSRPSSSSNRGARAQAIAAAGSSRSRSSRRARATPAPSWPAGGGGGAAATAASGVAARRCSTPSRRAERRRVSPARRPCSSKSCRLRAASSAICSTRSPTAASMRPASTVVSDRASCFAALIMRSASSRRSANARPRSSSRSSLPRWASSASRLLAASPRTASSSRRVSAASDPRQASTEAVTSWTLWLSADELRRAWSSRAWIWDT